MATLIDQAVLSGSDIGKSPLQSEIHKPMPEKISAINGRSGEKAMHPAGVAIETPVSGIPEYPITLQHKPPADLDKVIPNAGFRRLGFNLLISSLAVPFIHFSFSYPTLKSWIPDPRLPIYLDQIHRTKHGSDSEVYDTEGRFVPEKFEELFSKFDRDNKGGLGWKDIQELVYTNMNINDPNGWIAERLEWWVTYLLLRDHKGLVSKEKIRAVYDGTIWETVAQEVEQRKNRTSMYKQE
ncbi:hypothetical protein GPECTOR_41g652 [Gonium pectorale]|uniref:EF-hand domain-containing protein n=1 Tax=Gonium pectorale TaxID=33097 RepID=A0A150GA36_GONPE|nr:hypothetical protein GPECTOR_41g652 [Gonium pectorale]|eukprot:KXZ46688.1 hypothetical protein GPECTOR_41g652 [Gonium pectorale]